MIKLLPAFIILIGLILLNAPIYVSILSSAIYVTIVVNGMPLQSVFTTMFEAVSKNNLLAIPFFILAGNFISGGTLGRRLVNVFRGFLDNVRGGISVACLVSNGIFGAISGSPPAATAVFSKIIHEPLKEAESDKLATGLVVSAAGLSSIIPPSISMIIFGVSTETSISNLFMAGILPGILIILLIGLYIVIIGKKPDKSNPFSWKRALKGLRDGLPVLILPVIILGGIYGGVLTPTEAGALSAVYCYIMSVFVMHEITVKQSFVIMKESAIVVTQCFFLIAASAFLSKALTISQFPQMIVETLGSIPKAGFLLILNVLLLIVGCFFDPSAATLILAPMILPVSNALGIEPIHLGIIFVVNLAVGMFTPPFGLNIFVAQGVLGKSTGEISRALVPFISLYIVGLLIITYVPWLSTFLPSVL